MQHKSSDSVICRIEWECCWYIISDIILLEWKWSDCIWKEHLSQQVSELHIEHCYDSKEWAAAVSQWELRWDEKWEQCSTEQEWWRLSCTELRFFSQVSIYTGNREETQSLI